MVWKAALGAIAAAALPTAPPPNIYPAVWHCSIDQQFECGPSGCVSRAANVAVRLDLNSAAYDRCSPAMKDCDSYGANYQVSGIFLTMTVPGRPVFGRLTADGQYSEDAAFGHSHIVSFGKCEPGPPPIRTMILPKEK